MHTHLVAYSESLGNVTNSDVNVVNDDVLPVANSHLILTEDYNLIAAWAFGANLSRMRFGNVALTQLGQNHLWPVDVSATVPDDPALIDFRDDPLTLPRDEEITFEATTSAVGPAQHGVVAWLATPQWNRNIPRGIDRFITRATALVVAGSETTWTALANITFERALYNGSYAVVGAWMVAANALAFRLRFPDQPSVGGKQLRPGALVQDTLALAPHPINKGGLGEWGRFHTFSPPQVQVLADAAGGTYDLFLDLVYLGRGREIAG